MYPREVVLIATAFRDAAELSIRKAALTAMHSAIEAYLATFSTASNSERVALCTSALDTLQNITAFNQDEGDDVSNDMLHIFEEPAMVVAVDWAASSLQSEPDEVCRVLKQGIVKLALHKSG